ncbi:diguanylate cyclase [Gordonia jinhuaensis]|uniref:PAS domain S-box-containing protein/diguanylate cyclase (GGDEF) domain-containing protein n=1 Tax=Gordonia jinhuaensis TaxID=1517702 RepID=A0A916TF18_9ACTN|nr:diguanylate cyclase [Gordonia jinhuaensis]GGB42531.1 hypothetical protein GCM10011489_32560 [Gordonia jinhuaensis]
MDRNFRDLIDLIPDAVCVHDGGRIVYANAAFARWMGSESTDDVVGAPIVKFVHPDSVPAMLDRIMRLRVVGDRSEPTDAVLAPPDGSGIEVEWVASLIEWEARPAYEVVFRDVGQQRRMHATLEYQTTLVEQISDAYIVTDSEMNVVWWNSAAERIYHRGAAEVHGTPVTSAVGSGIDPVAIALGGPVIQQHRDAEGAPLTARVSAAPAESGFALVCSDRTEIHQAEQHFLGLIETMPDGLLIFDRTGRVTAANPAARSILRLPLHAGDLIPSDPPCGSFTMEDGSHLSPYHPLVQDVLNRSISVTDVLVRTVDPDGVTMWLSLDVKPLTPGDKDSLITMRIADVTTQVTTNAKLEYRATHDPLTGLPNREGVLSRIDLAVQEGFGAAVLVIDLDHFSSINVARGHHVGDDVLCVAADRLRAALVGPNDLVGRVGSDEFVIVIDGDDSQTLTAAVDSVRDALADPLTIDGELLRIDASIGLTRVLPDDTRTAHGVLRDADVAMFAAKQSTKAQPEPVDAGMVNVTVAGVAETTNVRGEGRHGLDHDHRAVEDHHDKNRDHHDRDRPNSGDHLRNDQTAEHDIRAEVRAHTDGMARRT